MIDGCPEDEAFLDWATALDLTDDAWEPAQEVHEVAPCVGWPEEDEEEEGEPE